MWERIWRQGRARVNRVRRSQVQALGLSQSWVGTPDSRNLGRVARVA